MKRSLFTFAILFFPVVAGAAQRTFTDQDGSTVKAEFSGVKDGEVVLKERGTRKNYPLSDFCLDDRDFIIQSLKDKKNDKLIRELVEHVIRESNRKARRNGFQSGTSSNSSGTTNRQTSPVNGRPVAPTILGAPAQRSNESTEVTGIKPEQTVYEILPPTEDLLEKPENRRWTDLLEQSQNARFERVIEPGIVVLRNERTNRVVRLPLVILSREDVEYVQQLLKSDEEREIFPPDSPTNVTKEQEEQGFRVWTDRRGEKLAAKYVRRQGGDVVLSLGEEEKSFPYVGLSRDDRSRIDGFSAGGGTRSGNATILGSTGPPAPPIPFGETKPGGDRKAESGSEPEPKILGTPVPAQAPAQDAGQQTGDQSAAGNPSATVSTAPSWGDDVKTYVGYGMMALVVIVILKKLFG